jgi:hypothetical protein
VRDVIGFQAQLPYDVLAVSGCGRHLALEVPFEAAEYLFEDSMKLRRESRSGSGESHRVQSTDSGWPAR